jgi:hypothetical protein
VERFLDLDKEAKTDAELLTDAAIVITSLYPCLMMERPEGALLSLCDVPMFSTTTTTRKKKRWPGL